MFLEEEEVSGTFSQELVMNVATSEGPMFLENVHRSPRTFHRLLRSPPLDSELSVTAEELGLSFLVLSVEMVKSGCSAISTDWIPSDKDFATYSAVQGMEKKTSQSSLQKLSVVPCSIEYYLYSMNSISSLPQYSSAQYSTVHCIALHYTISNRESRKINIIISDQNKRQQSLHHFWIPDPWIPVNNTDTP
jgi:uncharacterized protein YceK